MRQWDSSVPLGPLYCLQSPLQNCNFIKAPGQNVSELFGTDCVSDGQQRTAVWSHFLACLALHLRSNFNLGGLRIIWSYIYAKKLKISHLSQNWRQKWENYQKSVKGRTNQAQATLCLSIRLLWPGSRGSHPTQLSGRAARDAFVCSRPSIFTCCFTY